MTKYSDLTRYLNALPAETRRHGMSFAEIERVVGFRLPASAGRHRPWWSNSTAGHSQARAWLDARWRVETVDLSEAVVIFAKQDSSPLAAQNTSSDHHPEGRQGVDGELTPAQFEKLARDIMSGYFGLVLQEGQAEGVPKRFDLVSPDGSTVGDAKYFTMVRGQSPPPAKFSVIAEYVWLLEKTNADRRFLVFGNDRRVPEEWLRRYAHLKENVEFYFLSMGSGRPERL